jgi:hypothetical protein
VNALANPKVGQYLGQSFLATYQKVGTFKVVNGQKQGGNVASYFCTADQRVLHAVAGPVNANQFLSEARWVIETLKMARLQGKDSSDSLPDFFRAAHGERLKQTFGLDIHHLDSAGNRPALDRQGKVHLLLAAAPAAKVEQVYKLVFENILGEKVSTAPVLVTRR